MTMGLLIPAQNFSFDNLNASNDSYPAWNSATNYIANLKQRVTRLSLDYEVLVTHTNADPLTDTTGKWGFIGPTGPFKLFDGKVGEKDPNGTNLRFWPQDSALVPNALALLGLEATAARLVIKNGPVTVYDKTIDLVDNSMIDDFWEYFFTPLSQLTEAIFLDLPMYFDARYELKVTTNNGASPGLCGELALGYSYTLGQATAGTGLGIVDYSRKDVDIFGNSILIPRPFVQSVDYQFIMPTNRARATQQIVGEVRARAAVYHTSLDSERLGTLTYGVLQDFSISLAGAEASIATITVQGLT